MSEPILPISHLEIRFLETLASFIENALKPLAKALAPYGSLAMWEVANEIEGLVQNKAKPAGGSLQRTL